MSDVAQGQPGETVDASWWESVAGSEDAANFEPAELLHEDLRALAHAANDEDGESLRARTLLAMARATSAMLDPESWTEPFAPAMVFNGSRSVVPSDLEEAELDLLAQALPLIDPVVLRARIADVVWTYRSPRSPATALIAAEAYLAVPLTWDAWTRSGRVGYRRVVELARRQGKPGADVLGRVAATLTTFLTSGDGQSFLRAQVSEVLRETGQVKPDQARELGERLATLAADVAAEASTGTRPERALLREACAWWLRGEREDMAWACQERIADSYALESEGWLAGDRPALVAAGPLEKSLELLRAMPRKYRSAHGLDEVISQRQARLRELRQHSLEELTPVRQDAIEIYDLVGKAQVHVSGLERPEALVALSRISPLFDVARQTVSAREDLAGSISRMLNRSTLSSDARKVSVGAGDPGAAPSEREILDELVRRNSERVGLVVQALILPATETLTTEHRFDLSFMEALCRESSTVPMRHASLWARGLWHGLNADFPSALALLVPQLEQMLRLRLKAEGVHTLYIGEQGVETEKAFGALLDMDGATAFLGENLSFELRSMLLEQVGPNLRNEMAHGLLTDGGMGGAASIYTWWLCLRIALAPYVGGFGGDEEQEEGEEHEEGEGRAEQEQEGVEQEEGREEEE